MTIKIRKKNIYIVIAFFALLFPYLQGSIGLLTGKLAYCFMPVLAIALAFLYNPKRVAFNAKELVVWTCILFPCVFRNYDIKTGYNNVLNFIVVFAIYKILREKEEWMTIFWKVVRFYCVVHFALGIFFLFNKGLLYSWVIPRFTMKGNVYNLLTKAISNGYMTGICNHYSKMGMYMALGTVAYATPLFESSTINAHKKFQYALFGAFIIGLAMTGKRGPLLFTLLALFLAFIQFANKKPTKKALIRLFIGIMVIILVFLFAYLKIPQIKLLIARFMEGSSIADKANGRIEFFWVQAIDMFKSNPLLGYGWGAFKSYSMNGNDAHNIYFQLLAETGMVGFWLSMAFFVGSLVVTKRDLGYIEKIPEKADLSVSLKLAYSYQIFFLLYGLTGNPLYDGQCYLPYLISCAIGWSVYFSNTNKVREMGYE